MNAKHLSILFASGLAAACSDSTPAQLVVVVSSDLRAPAELDAIQIRLRDANGTIIEDRAVPLSASQPLPVSFGVAPSGDDVSRAADIEIAPRLGGSELFRTRVRTGFVAGKRLRLDIFLAGSCVAAACGDTAACFGGFCTGGPIEIPAGSLPEHGGDASQFDAGIPRSDAEPIDGAPADGGVADADAGSPPDTGERCSIGRDLLVEAPQPDHVYASPAIAWSGTEFAIAWVDFDLTTRRGKLVFARIAGDGDRRLDQGWVEIDTTHTGTTASPETTSILWTGTDYAAVWSDVRLVGTTGRLFFARLTESSTRATAPVMIAEVPASHLDQPSLARDGTSFGVAWREDYGFGKFTLLSETGMPSGTVVDLGDGSLSQLVFAEPQREWAIAISHYVDADNYEIYLRRILDDGRTIADLAPPEFPGTINASSFPSIAWTGSDFGISWLEGRGPPDTWDVAFNRLSSAGATLMPFANLASPAVVQYPLTLAYTDSLAFGLFWWDDYSIRFARVAPDGRIRATIPSLNTGSSGASSAAVAAAGNVFGVGWAQFEGIHFTVISCE